MLVSIVIPTYNESENIAAIVARATAVLQKKTESFEIIVVDDNSPDATWKITEELAESNPHLRVIRRRDQRGLATAVVAGWKVARGEILGVMDGDFQHPPEVLTSLLVPIVTNKADIAIASRHVKGGGIRQWGLHRTLLSSVIARLTKLILPHILKSLRDPMSGYFLARRSVIRGVDLRPRGYKILLEVLAKGIYQNFVEVAYVFEGRKRGSSKAGPKQCLESLIHIGSLLSEPRQNRRLGNSSSHPTQSGHSLWQRISSAKLVNLRARGEP